MRIANIISNFADIQSLSVEKKKNVRNQLIVAWLLLLVFMPMNMVKTFHHHADTSAHDTEQKASHSHDNCQICQFVLSPFLEAESCELTLTAIIIDCQPVAYSEQSYATALNSYYLRGPPELMA